MLLETQPLTFILVMTVLALIGIVVFVVYLVVRNKGQESVGGSSVISSPTGPRWFEYLLAVLALIALVVAVVVVTIFLYPSGPAIETAWRGETRSIVFLVAMLLAGLGALVAFVIGAFVRRGTSVVGREPESGSTLSAPDPIETPAGSRLLGLLVLVVAVLVLSWVYIDSTAQHRLMSSFIYPAVLGVALVLLFDKATRAWSIKANGESFREWVFCDALVFVLFLGYLNLVQLQVLESYSGLFWDVLNLVLFFFVLWLVDRKVTRYRFLVAYGYFTVAPILLHIWRWVHATEETVEAVAWWSSVWPFVVLAIIFVVIEVISLVVTRGSQRQGGGALRDTVFIVLYGILLFSAMP